MSGGTDGVTEERGRTTGVTDHLWRVVRGDDDPRLRATYRALLPAALVTSVLTPLAVVVAGAVVPLRSPGVAPMAAIGLLQGALVAGLLVVWARFVDRRPLGEYGLAATPAWALDVVVAVLAVVVGHAAWFALGSALGWTEVTLAPSAGDAGLAVGLLGVLVAVGVNVWVQETVFVAIPLRNAAEGLAVRGVTPLRAVLAGWVIATLLFAFVHGRTGLGAWINLLVALGTYALLYVHTGELALPVGVHFGVNYLGKAVLASGGRELTVLRVTESLGGLAGTISAGRLPPILAAYCLLLAWLRWRDGEVTVRADVAEWTGR